MSKKEDFDNWMEQQGPLQKQIKLGGLKLSDAQVKLLREYPEVEFSNDLPHSVQKQLIQLNPYDALQEECDAFLEDQYSLLSRNFKEFIMKNREPTE
jgi:hypothetical protein